ncbi:hypothetical protein QYH69_15760 [Paraburkholderia sp. SARCC-3016]|uniref:hypothetical protein n=1 Tax=Paraburkholderia sp. SARCC-3016 TaxID=3058611 RepID=UPI002808005F|nr:hypothetical protein [Paraburkholderia sp. SARCC-3016]MDQ7978707.1 hypothetical protein [Paraburkholderia sp. SARCC-3016]
MAAVLAQFIADQSGQNSVDDGTTATLEANLIAAIRNATKATVILADTGVANAYTAVNTPPLSALPSTGYVQRVNIAHANTGASTYAPDGLTAKPIYGLGLQPLQGGELPVGVAVLMYLVQSSVNSGNGAWIIIESLGGAQQIAPATASNQAASLGQIPGLTGQSVNLKISQPTASTSLTVTADVIIVTDPTTGISYQVKNVNLTIVSTATGANGWDLAAGPTSGGFGALYLIYNPTTNTAALLGTNVTTVAGTTTYSGSAPVSGYTASGKIAAWTMGASKVFNSGYQRGRKRAYSGGNFGTTTATSTPTTFSMSGYLPPDAVEIEGTLNAQGSNSGSALQLTISADSTGTVGGREVAGSATTGNLQIAPYGMLLATPQTAFYTATVASGVLTVAVAVTGYTI